MRKSILLSAFALIALFAWFHAYAQESWRAEFDDICGRTEQSMTMTLEELKALVVRCDKLKQEIEAMEIPQKSIILKRLEKCRKLFGYMVEVKENEQK